MGTAIQSRPLSKKKIYKQQITWEIGASSSCLKPIDPIDISLVEIFPEAPSLKIFNHINNILPKAQ